MADNFLVARHDDLVCQGTFTRQGYLVPGGLVNPSESELLIDVLHTIPGPTSRHRVTRVVLAWLLDRLGVDEGVA